MKPIFIVESKDYTRYLSEDGLSPVRNDLDSDGSGRNLLDGLMYRTRIAQKDKWTVKFNRIPADVMQKLAMDCDGQYTSVTLLHPKLNRVVTMTFYISGFTYGSQRYDKGDDLVYYDGCTFNMTER